MAADFIQGEYYGGVGIGLEDLSNSVSYDPGVTLVLNGGKPIIQLGPGVLGAEGELTYTIVPLKADHRYYDDELKILTLGAYATYTYDITSSFYARGKAGIVYRDYDHDSSYHYYNNTCNSCNSRNYRFSNSSKANIAIGIGGGYKINSTIRIFTDLIFLDSFDLKQLNLGVQMSF
jgi:hypothetical protein